MLHTLAFSWLLGAVALGAALSAQAQTAPAAAARKPVAETPLGSCAAANRQSLLDLGQAIDAAVRRNVASPMVVARLQGAKAQVAKLRDGLPATQRTLPDCEATASAINAEKERLVRVAGADPEATDCVAANQKSHAALLQGYDAAQRASLPPDEAAALQASGTRLNTLGAALARGNLLLTDCRQLGAQLAQERVAIERWMGAGSPALPVAAAMTTTTVPPAPTVQTVQAGQIGLGGVPAPAAAPAAPVPAAPAATATRAPGVAAAAATPQAPATAAAPGAAMPALAPVPSLSAPPALPPTPEACRESQATQYNQVAQAFATVAQTSAMSPDKVMVFQALSDRLTRLRGLIADRNAPGWDCAGVLQGLQQVRTELQPLVAPPPTAVPAAPAAAPAHKR